MEILQGLMGGSATADGDKGKESKEGEGVLSLSTPSNNTEAQGAVTLSSEALDSGVFGEDYKTLQGQALIDQMAKEYMTLSATKRTAINIPTENATEEERKAFLSSIEDVEGLLVIGDGEGVDERLKRRLGIPEKGEGYDIPKGQYSEQDEGSLRRLGEKLSLSNKQLIALADIAVAEKDEQLGDEVKEKEEMVRERNTTLNKLWGDDAQKRFSGAELALKHLANEAGAEWLDHFKKINAMDNPLVIMAMCEMAKGLTEKGTLVNTQVDYGHTVAEINQRIHDIREDKDYFTATPRAKTLRKELIALQTQLPD